MAKSKAQQLANTVAEKMASEMQAQFAKDKAAAAERLYNAFADALNEQKPTVETALYVLKMVERSIIEEAYSKMVAPGVEVPNIMQPSPIGVAPPKDIDNKSGVAIPAVL
jgi:hypothetical protein